MFSPNLRTLFFPSSLVPRGAPGPPPGPLDPLQIFGNQLEFWGDSVKQGDPLGAVSQITDFSNNANHAVAPAGTNEAVAQSGADGKSEWLFDGVDDFYDMGSVVNLPSSEDWHAWMVVEKKDAPFEDSMVFGDSASSDDYLNVNTDLDETRVKAGPNPSVVAIAPADQPGPGIYSYRVAHAASVNEISGFIDGVEKTDPAGPENTQNFDPRTIGTSDDAGSSTNYFDGVMRLLVLVGGTITPQQIADMDTYAASVKP